MLSKAVGSYTATDVDYAIQGEFLPPVYRTRVELLDRDGQHIRWLSKFILNNSSVKQTYSAEAQRSASIAIMESNLDLDSFSDLVIASGPLFYLHLNEASGTTAADSSGNARNFTINGTVTYRAPGLVAGESGDTGITLNGSSGYLSRANESWMNVSHFTFMFWRKGTGKNRCLLDRNNYRVGVDSSGFLYITPTFTSGSPVNPTYTFSGDVCDGNAYPIFITYDGVWIKAFVNGNLLGKFAETRTLATASVAINIGRTLGGLLYDNATDDEIAMWDRALSHAEQRTLYQAGVNDLREVDFNRGDRIRIYKGIRMQPEADVADDTKWAEYARFTGLLAKPKRRQSPYGVVASVECQDLTRVAMLSSYSNRHTVNSGVNYLTGTNGVLAVAASCGYDTSTWLVTSTTLTLPTTRDWPIGTPKIKIIHDLLDEIQYEHLRFRGDGVGVIEPKVLAKDRAAEATLIADSTSIINADGAEESKDSETQYNAVFLYVGNFDSPTLSSYGEITSLANPSSVYYKNAQTNILVQQVEAESQTALDTMRDQKLIELAQEQSKITAQILQYPVLDARDIVNLQMQSGEFLTDALGINAKYVVLEWTEPCDPLGQMSISAELAAAA